MHHGQNRGEAEKRKLNTKNRKFNENKGVISNFCGNRGQYASLTQRDGRPWKSAHCPGWKI